MMFILFWQLHSQPKVKLFLYSRFLYPRYLDMMSWYIIWYMIYCWTKLCASGILAWYIAYKCHCPLILLKFHGILSVRFWGMRSDTRIRVWVRLHTFPTAVLVLWSIDIFRRGGCVLAVCQGRTIYPADDVEERRRRRAGLLLGMLWIHVQPTACQHRCMMDSWDTVEKRGKEH